MKPCSRCLEEKDHSEFNRDKSKRLGLSSWCKSCVSERHRERYANDPEYREKHKKKSDRAKASILAWKRSEHGRRVSRAGELKRKFGLTLADFARMKNEQGGGCAICGTTEPGGQGNRLHVDHDHTSGQVRGLLCSNCNRGLGHFQDDPELLRKAISYLNLHFEES